MENKNLKECPSGKQIEKVSHWANLNDINPLSYFQVLNRRVFFWIFRKKVPAALTVEAAVIVPIFVLALCTLMSVLDCYRIQSIVKASIHQSALELGTYAYALDGKYEDIPVVNTAFCIAYAQAHLPEMEENVTVSMASSHYKNNTVTLIATITYRLPISIFFIPALKMINISEVSGWVGESYEEEFSSIVYEMVYVTENKSVYHTSASCSHIDIKVYEMKGWNVAKKYNVCQKCSDGQIIEKNEVVYYTKTGECYHTKKECSSLKREVRMVDISQVRGLQMCERCEKRGHS